MAAAMTGSEITLTDAPVEDILPTTARLIEMGCDIKTEGKTALIKSPERLKPLSCLKTEPHPGFPGGNKGRHLNVVKNVEFVGFFVDYYFCDKGFYVGAFFFHGEIVVEYYV